MGINNMVQIKISNWNEFKPLIDELVNHPNTTETERQFLYGLYTKAKLNGTDISKVVFDYDRKIGFLKSGKFKVMNNDDIK